MDTGRQIIRWSIPGSILALLAFAVNLVSALTERRLEGNKDLGLTLSSEVVALVALATVPIGYTVYQYYYSRDGRIRRFPASLVPIDRGFAVLLALVPDDRDAFLDDLGVARTANRFADTSAPPAVHHRPTVAHEVWWGTVAVRVPSLLHGPIGWLRSRFGISDDVRDERPAHGRGVGEPADPGPGRVVLWSGLRLWRLSVESTPWRDRARDLLQMRNPGSFWARRQQQRHEFYLNTQRNNEVVRSSLAVLAVGEAGSGVLAEYTALSDIYHGLGATRTAIALGYPLGVLSTLFAPDRTTSGNVIAWLVCGAAAGILYWKLHRNRSQVLIRLLETTAHGLTWLSVKRARDLRAPKPTSA